AAPDRAIRPAAVAGPGGDEFPRRPAADAGWPGADRAPSRNRVVWARISPSFPRFRSYPAPPRGHGNEATTRLQRAGNLLDLEALDHIANLDVLVVLEGHAAFVALADLADLVLEPLQRLQAALMDHDIVAQQPHFGAPPDDSLSDHAAGDFAGSGDVEHLADRGIAEEPLAQSRCQHPRKRVPHVVDHIIDDRVVADLDAVALRQIARLRVGADIEADDHRAGRLGQ